MSHATVSFVLNDRRDVTIPETTRQRVLNTAEQMGYVPNHAARALVSGRSDIVAVWMPTPVESRQSELLREIVRSLDAEGFGTLLCDPNSAKARTPSEWPVDGVIVAGCGLWQSTRGRRLPSVGIGTTEPSIDQIEVDLTAAYEESLQHLLRIGCRRVALTTLATPGREFAHRADVFCTAANRIGLSVRVLAAAPTDETQSDAYVCDREEDAIALHLRQRFCAVVVTTGRGVVLPGMEWFGAIHLPTAAMARHAVRTLQWRKANPLAEPVVVRTAATYASLRSKSG